MALERAPSLRTLLTDPRLIPPAFVVALGLSLLAYLALASLAPSAALLACSLLAIAGALFGTLWIWPMERKITWQRQMEVLGYRLLAAVLTYGIIGYGTLFAINTFSPQIVPLDTPNEMLRRLPFWPFYALVVLGCQTPIPAPGGAC